MTQLPSHYLHFIWMGGGTVVKFRTNSLPPRVGELVDLSRIAQLNGTHKVIQVKHVYSTNKDENESDVPRIEIWLDEAAARELNHLRQA
jgi:hypothetical protein